MGSYTMFGAWQGFVGGYSEHLIDAEIQASERISRESDAAHIGHAIDVADASLEA